MLPGTDRDTSLEEARALLREHGAVMVKAVAGGGGRGVRPVTREADLASAMRRCASEAAATFGDGRVYVERLLLRARQVEVQVIGDGTGAVAVLGDRDCSDEDGARGPGPGPGLVREVPVAAGATVQAGAVLVVLEESPNGVAEPARANDVALDHVRPDLAEVRERHRIGLDEGRPEATG